MRKRDRRGLTRVFKEDLLGGKLAGLLEAVKHDYTLCLEIREGYINVYYRGGCLFKVIPGYTFDFDKKYFGAGGWPFVKPVTIEEWLAAIPDLKTAMDSYFLKHPKAEREVQQMILRDNTNTPVANGIDYFITDIEYAGQGFRFDMVAAKWLAKDRKRGDQARLAIIEVKYADKSLGGDAGLYKHMQDVIALLESEDKLCKLIEETNMLANQKRALGLFPKMKHNKNEIAIPKERREIELIFVLVNTNPRSSKLEDVLAEIRKDRLIHRLNELNCTLLLAKASYMGYGLYADCMEEIKAEI